MNDLMTTREVADYLRLRERKIYDLVRNGAIPCTRVTGKWLFPRSLIDLWLLENAEGAGCEPRTRPAAIVAGSHDPLLEWAVQASGSGLALLVGGSMEGLSRFARGEVAVCGLHIPEDEGGYNLDTVSRTVSGDYVVIAWARRNQGLMLAADNPLGIATLSDLRERGARVIDRQEGAGSNLLLGRLLAEAGVDRSEIAFVDAIAVNHADVAREVHAGNADAGLGIEAAARDAGLSFLPLVEERFDLVIDRREYFEAPVQSLLALTDTDRFAQRATALGGYDLTETGSVRYNAA